MPKNNKNSSVEDVIDSHVTEYLFPGGTIHTPDVLSMARADKMTCILRRRLSEFCAQGVDVTALSVEELLGMRPDDIELTEDDFC